MTRIKSTKEDLEKSMQHIGEAMAKAGQAAGQQQQQGGGAGSNQDFGGGQQQQQQQSGGGAREPDEIEDAEVEIIDDNKQQ